MLKKKVRIDLKNPSIQRINEKCINCGVCFNTCENEVGIDHDRETDVPSCINCGACIQSCPTGALVCKYNYKGILNLIKDTDKKIAISIAPAIRVSLGEELSLPIGTNLESLLPAILKEIGFDYVFDVTFGADVTVIEETKELLRRLKNKTNLPLFTSCCPSWVKYAGMYHPELLQNLSTTKSPIGIQSTLIKTYFREFNEIEDEIISVVVAPCTAKKYEVQNSDTDYCITTRELAYMIKECKIDIDSLKPCDFDPLLSHGSKAGCMFGRSGGVASAILNTAYYLTTEIDPKEDNFHIDIKDEIETRSFKLGSKIINVAIVSGMKALEEILKHKEDFDMIEVMNCKGGCIGGGGNPLGPASNKKERLEERTKALNNCDALVSYSYQNRMVEDLYDYYIEIKGSHFLHTTHEDLSHLVLPKKDENIKTS